MRSMPAEGMKKQAIFYGCLLLVWQFVCAAKIWPDYVFPSPLGVASAIVRGFSDHSFIFATVVSLRRILLGFGIAVILGGIFGTLMARYKTLNDTFGRLVTAIQTLPSICWFPLAIVWFGLSETSVIFIVVMGSFFSITLSVYAGIKNIPAIYLQTARNMGARRARMLWWVLFPAAAPALIVGLKQGWSFAWRSLMAAELLFVNLGLGFLLMMGRELNDIRQVSAVMVMIMAISILTDKFVFGALESAIKKGRA
jgi:NitT/TauT family transport system permease protein